MSTPPIAFIESIQTFLRDYQVTAPALFTRADLSYQNWLNWRSGGVPSGTSIQKINDAIASIIAERETIVTTPSEAEKRAYAALGLGGLPAPQAQSTEEAEPEVEREDDEDHSEGEESEEGDVDAGELELQCRQCKKLKAPSCFYRMNRETKDFVCRSCLQKGAYACNKPQAPSPPFTTNIPDLNDRTLMLAQGILYLEGIEETKKKALLVALFS